MPLDLFFDIGALLVTLVAAFALSSAVGMLLGILLSVPQPHGDSPDEPRSRPA